MTIKGEFYFGLFSSLIVAFIIPLVATVFETSPLLFLTYLYLPVGVGLIVHVLYEEERKSLPTETSGENPCEGAN